MTAGTFPTQSNQLITSKTTRSTTRMRRITLDDRALVYSTIARLQASGLAYRGCGQNHFLIVDTINDSTPHDDARNLYDYHERDTPAGTNSVVFLTSPAEIVSGLSRIELEARAEEWHWDALHCLFADLASRASSEHTTSKSNSMSPCDAACVKRAIVMDTTSAHNRYDLATIHLLMPLPQLAKHTITPRMALHPNYLLQTDCTAEPRGILRGELESASSNCRNRDEEELGLMRSSANRSTNVATRRVRMREALEVSSHL